MNREKISEELSSYTDRQILNEVFDMLSLKNLKILLKNLKENY